MNKHYKFLSILALTVFLGCDQHIGREINSLFNKSADIKRSDVIGEYVFNHSFGKDIVILKPDGTYLHKHTHISGEIFEESDKWEFEFIYDESRITFYGFNFSWKKQFWEQKRIVRKKTGFWSAPVENYFGKIRIVVSYDLGLLLEKKEDANLVELDSPPIVTPLKIATKTASTAGRGLDAISIAPPPDLSK